MPKIDHNYYHLYILQGCFLKHFSLGEIDTHTFMMQK